MTFYNKKSKAASHCMNSACIPTSWGLTGSAWEQQPHTQTRAVAILYFHFNSNPLTHQQLEGSSSQISSSRFNPLLHSHSGATIKQETSLSFTCYANHRPLCRVEHRGLALSLPPLVFGEVPRQRVSGQARRAPGRARGQRPRRPLAPEGRLAEAGALAEGVVVGRLHPASEAEMGGREEVRISEGSDGWMEKWSSEKGGRGKEGQRGGRSRRRKEKGSLKKVQAV